mgnify:CR=1 FL=1
MLGIKENDKPIDIEYLVTALRNQLRLYPERIPNIGEFMCIDKVGYNGVDIHTIFDTITEEVELIICLNKCN